MPPTYDVVVVGAGPNGLSAAITAARQGLSTLIVEAADTPGGGLRSAELTIPGFVHDVCSAVHPMAVASPFFQSLPLAEHGLRWINAPVACAHPLDDGHAVLIAGTVDDTARALGADADAYRSIVGWLVQHWRELAPAVLGPLGWPKHPVLLARFGLEALMPATLLARTRFRGERARALFGGLAAHSLLPLDWPASSAIGLVLGAVAHAYGWPIPQGGSQALATALASYFVSLGGAIRTGEPITTLDELPPSRIVLCDTSPRALVRLAGARLPSGVRRAFERFRYGPGVWKVDWALSGPIPWMAPDCRDAGTVHIGGTLAELAESERAPWRGSVSERPFVLLAQPSIFDPSRAPAGRHTAWAYCHVPNGSCADMTERIEAQIERFAPGFRESIIGRAVRGPRTLEEYDANLLGGDISGGANTLRQLFLRPTWRRYGTGVRGLYLCSASTPPGGGVHGMCGYHAASWAIRAEQRSSSRRGTRAGR